MGSILSLLPPDGWARLMIDTLWQGTLIVGLGWIVARLLVPQAAARAWIILMALTACLLVPLASMGARSVGWAVLSRPSTNAEVKPFRADNNSVPTSIATANRIEFAPAESPTIGENARFDQSIAAQQATTTSYMGPNWLLMTGIVWLLVSAFLFTRLVMSLWVVWRILRQATPCNDSQLVEAALEASRRVGLPHPPRLLISNSVSTPMVFALTRSIILLPSTDSSPAGGIDWTAVFAHELAHVVRRDGWSRLWVQLVTIAVPLQPLMWLARRDFCMACEEACDDWAVAVGSDPVQLATTLTAWTNRPMRPGPLLAIGMSSTKARILRLLALRAKPLPELSTSWRWTGISAAIVLTAGLAMAQLPADGRQQPDVTGEPSKLDNSSQVSRPRPQSEITSEKNAEQTSNKIVISGTCLDETKKPLAGAQVRLFFLDYYRDDKFQQLLQEVRTSEMGQFQFMDVDIQQVRDRHAVLQVIAQSPGKATIVRRIDQDKANETSVDFTLPSAGAMRGRITAADGTPVAGATVSANCSGLLEPIPGICAAVTDADGQYEIADLIRFNQADQKPQPIGNGMFVMAGASLGQVRHPDYARQPFTYATIPSTIDVTLHRSAIVEGQVTLTNPVKPAAGAQVEFWNDDVRPDYWTRSKTDERGRYRLANLPPGTYRVSATLEGRPNLFLADIVLTSGRNNRDLLMGEGGQINGRVIDVSTGKPVELGHGETMSISESIGRGRVSYAGMNAARIQPDGTFTLLLPAGRSYLGMYLGPNWRGINTDALLRTGIEVAEGQDIDLEIRVKPRTPGDDQPPKPLSPEQVSQLAEQAATAAIKQLGGWVETENIDGQDHVVGVNMVYHEDGQLGRQENRLLSDECLSYVRKFPKLKKLLLTREQATDAALSNVRGMESLETVMIWDASAVTDAGVAHLATLPNLKSIHISNSQITDESLRHFSGLRNVEHLSLQGNHFTDRGLPFIQNMTQLRELSLGLGKNEITDDGLRYLSGLTNLERLDLQQSKVTDAGLPQLRDLKKLRKLWLNGTGVTQTGMEELRKSLPNLTDERRR